MLESLLEVVPELAYGLVVAALGAVGVAAEIGGIRNLVSGQMVLGVWMVSLGLLALYAGQQVARDKALPLYRGH